MPTESVLDLIDDFTLLRANKAIESLPGRTLYEFGAEVREFSRKTTPVVDLTSHPVYLGGWPSANFWFAHGDLLMSSLLYSGQILVRDPIADWFSKEQYQVEHMIGVRPGYLLNPETPNVAQTRSFLAGVLPALQRLRPLIDAGIIVLVPSERSFYRHSDQIDELRTELETTFPLDPLAYARAFSPADIAVEDNLRGVFTFAGGDREQQIMRVLRHGLRYFSREYLLAEEYGATYVAPFPHEHFLCNRSINQVVGPSGRVSQALLKSQLPIFSGLTPELIKDIHKDDSFGAFREDLHKIYQNAPVEKSSAEMDAFVHDQEQVLLRPKIKDMEASAKRGILGRIGTSLSGSGFTLSTGLAADLVLQTGGLGTVIGALKTAADSAFQNHQPKGARRIWMTLAEHHRSVEGQFEQVSAPVPSQGEDDYWGIPQEPSLNVYISGGVAIGDYLRPISQPSPDLTGYVEGNYRPCDCKSGLKYRFCCYGLKI